MILQDARKNRSISHAGVREHYLDDEIKGKKFMQDVGPTTYETFNKKVAVPANLPPNLGPSPLKIDSKDGLKNYD